MNSKNVWYIQKLSGNIEGPYTDAQILKLARQGDISRSAKLKHPQQTNDHWVPSTNIPGLGAIVLSRSPAGKKTPDATGAGVPPVSGLGGPGPRSDRSGEMGTGVPQWTAKSASLYDDPLRVSSRGAGLPPVSQDEISLHELSEAVASLNAADASRRKKKVIKHLLYDVLVAGVLVVLLIAILVSAGMIIAGGVMLGYSEEESGKQPRQTSASDSGLKANVDRVLRGFSGGAFKSPRDEGKPKNVADPKERNSLPGVRPSDIRSNPKQEDPVGPSDSPIQDKVFGNHGGAVLAVASTSGCKKIATGTENGTLRIWDAKTSAEPWSHKAGGKIIFVAFSEDESRLFAANENTFFTFNLQNNYDGEKKALPMKTSRISASKDCRRLLLIPTVQDSKNPAILFSTEDGLKVKTFQRDAGVASGAVSRDGEIVVCGEYSQDIHNVLGNQTKKNAFSNWGYLEGMEISPRGNFLVTGSGKLWEREGNKIGNRQVRVWDLRTGTEKFHLDGHSSWIHTVAVSPDETQILSAGGGSPKDYQGAGEGADRSVRLWSVSGRKNIWTGDGHSKAVLNVAFSPDGAYAVSGSRDGTARIWKLPVTKQPSASEPFGRTPRSSQLDE